MRRGVEGAFGRYSLPHDYELLGTLVLDDRRLVVLFRELDTGDVQRVVNDVEEIRVRVPATDVERLVLEVLVETIHQRGEKTYAGRDRWGVHEWDDGPSSVSE